MIINYVVLSFTWATMLRTDNLGCSGKQNNHTKSALLTKK